MANLSDQIAFLGTGLMDGSMAAQLLERGHELAIWNRSPAKAALLVQQGGTMCSTPAEAARKTKILCLCMTDAEAAEEVGSFHWVVWVDS